MSYTIFRDSSTSGMVMATVIGGPGLGGFDMSTLDIAEYQDLSFINGNSILVRYNYAPSEPNYLVEFFGSGFNPDANGNVTAGTINRIVETSSGQLVFDVSGFAVLVPMFLTWVNTGNTVAALQTILAGADSITGSVFDDLLFGVTGNDSIFGAAGDDGLAGNQGNDFLDGGDGWDVAGYLGGVNDYTLVTYKGTTGVLPETAQLLQIDGVDKLVNVEEVVFATGLVIVAVPQQNFSAMNYIASYGDLSNVLGTNDLAGFDHYIYSGFYEGRQVTFSGMEYIASYGDLMAAFGANADAGAGHYIQVGRFEGRTTSFDGLQYIASYSDLIAAFGANKEAGGQHYIQSGHTEGRTRDAFDAQQYLSKYMDLQLAFGDDLNAATVHFIEHGFAEGRDDIWMG